MSEQCSEQFRSELQEASLPSMSMFGLIRDLPLANEPWNECLEWFEYEVPPNNPTDIHSSALCRGYIGHHVLNSDGSLTLTQYEYPSFDTTPSSFDQIDLVIGGDFWMILKEHSFSASTTFIPFLDGKIVTDSSEWIIQQ